MKLNFKFGDELGEVLIIFHYRSVASKFVDE